MKITLKTVILASLIFFNLVIIISNFTNYEGLENKSHDENDEKESISDEKASTNDEKNSTPKKTKSSNDLQATTEPTKEDIKYGIVGEGDIASS
jgi:cytoskeletal protein RodZ